MTRHKQYWATLLAAFAVSMSTSLHAQGSHAWKTYVNSRYGYSLCYPADLFRPGPEPDARDGVTFKGPSGTTLITAGGYVVDDSTPASVATDEAKAVAGDNARITYRAGHSGWAVVSGNAGVKTFYVREVRTKNVLAGFQFVYPKADAARYTAAISKMNACFSLP